MHVCPHIVVIYSIKLFKNKCYLKVRVNSNGHLLRAGRTCARVCAKVELVTYKKNNRQSVNTDYDCILAMLLGSSRNGTLKMTRFSIPTASGTVSVIQNDAKCNLSGLTSPGSLNTRPMCEGQRWIFNLPMILLGYTGSPSSGE